LERRELVRAWRVSGLSAGAFSRQNKIAQTTLLRWAAQVGLGPAAAAAPDFVRLEVARRATPLVVQAGRARIFVEPGFDAALLRTVVDALSGGTA
jgi:hypothetical protein